MKQGSYKVCQGCLKPIQSNGVEVSTRQGRGWSKNTKFYHRGCFNKVARKSKPRLIPLINPKTMVKLLWISIFFNVVLFIIAVVTFNALMSAV
jgi:hypothetical protein